MCKFESESAPGFDVVAEAIMRYAEDAPRLISGRWDEERRHRDLEKQEAAKEILRGMLSMAQTDLCANHHIRQSSFVYTSRYDDKLSASE